MGSKRRPRRPQKASKMEEVTVMECDPEAMQVLKALARIKDPMTRYLLSMLIDRLTEQMEKLLQAQEPLVVSVKETRSKIN